MNNKVARFIGILLLVFVPALIAGCASVPGPRDEGDPLESFNRAMYTFNDTLDRAVLKPVARGYAKVMPSPVNRGITNFFGNIGDVVIIFNDLLQFKLIQAASDTGRVLINTTIGILGFIDVAGYMGLEKHNEDFGQTLGYWGIGDGTYIVWPFFGPSTVRDTVGDIVDYYVDPLNDVTPHEDRTLLQAIEIIDRRADLLSASRVLEEAALDPYIFVRDAYLQRRRHLVHDGNPPPDPDAPGP